MTKEIAVILCAHCVNNHDLINLVALDGDGFLHFVCDKYHRVDEMKVVGLNHISPEKFGVVLGELLKLGYGSQADFDKAKKEWVYSPIIE